MNRRQFLRDGAMAIVAVSVAPTTVPFEFASGGIVTDEAEYIIGEHVFGFPPIDVATLWFGVVGPRSDRSHLREFHFSEYATPEA